MTFARFTLPALLIIAPFVPGCLPNDMPAYTNGGRTIVLMAEGKKGDALWTYDLQTASAFAHRSPGKGELEYARMLGDQVWVQWEAGCTRFDPVKNEFVPAPEGFGRREWLRDAIPASHEGKKSLFLPPENRPNKPNEKIPYTAYSFPEMKKMATVPLDQVIPTGGFWWVNLRIKRDNPRDEGEVEFIEVFNDAGKKIVTIESEESRKMKYARGRFSGYARMGEDGKILFLLFGESRTYKFGVFDTTSGKFLWGGYCDGDVISGNPLVRRTEVLSLEIPLRGLERIAFVRHTPGDSGDARKDKHETIMEYPVDEAFMDDHYTLSPDGSRFVMKVSGSPPLLLFIPIGAGVTAKDVVRVELKE